jgi:hypothetical protein
MGLAADTITQGTWATTAQEVAALTHILLVDPKDELIVHNIPIHSKDSVRKVEKFWKEQEIARGHELERVLILGGRMEIMGREDKIPVPVW